MAKISFKNIDRRKLSNKAKASLSKYKGLTLLSGASKTGQFQISVKHVTKQAWNLDVVRTELLNYLRRTATVGLAMYRQTASTWGYGKGGEHPVFKRFGGVQLSRRNIGDVGIIIGTDDPVYYMVDVGHFLKPQGYEIKPKQSKERILTRMIRIVTKKGVVRRITKQEKSSTGFLTWHPSSGKTTNPQNIFAPGNEIVDEDSWVRKRRVYHSAEPRRFTEKIAALLNALMENQMPTVIKGALKKSLIKATNGPIVVPKSP